MKVLFHKSLGYSKHEQDIVFNYMKFVADELNINSSTLTFKMMHTTEKMMNGAPDGAELGGNINRPLSWKPSFEIRMNPKYCKPYVLDGKHIYEKFRLFATISHEMVHAKQYMHDGLRFIAGANSHQFKGGFFSGAMDYSDQPWEHEADKIGDELIEKYVHLNKNNNMSGFTF